MRQLGRQLVGIGLLVLLAACGGGGGDGGSSAPPLLPLAPLSQDEIPSGPRVDWGMAAPFPLALGNSWRYTLRKEGSASQLTVERYVSALQGELLTLAELEAGQRSETRMRWTPEGLQLEDPFEFGVDFPALLNALPRWIELPTPLYAAGSARRALRQGSLARDIDGDNRNDDYRLEIEQVFVGFETLELFGQPTRVAHLRTRVALGLGKTTKNQIETSRATEDIYLADGLGPVRLERRYEVAPGETPLPAETLSLEQALVNDVSYQADGPSFALPLRGVVGAAWDGPRQQLLVVAGNGEPGDADRLLIVDPRNGRLQRSAPLGDSLTAVALAADGASVYVASGGEILRLRLPDLQLLSRTPAPAVPIGRMNVLALLASPLDPELVVVSLSDPSAFNQGGEVHALRNGQWLAQRAGMPNGDGAAWPLVFAGDGRRLYAQHASNVENGLHRLVLGADGIGYQDFVPATGLPSYQLQAADGWLIAGNQVLREVGDLLHWQWQQPEADHCLKVAGVARLACFSNSTALGFHLQAIDLDSRATLPGTKPAGNLGINSSSTRLLLARPGLVVAADSNRLIVQSHRGLR